MSRRSLLGSKSAGGIGGQLRTIEKKVGKLETRSAQRFPAKLVGRICEFLTSSNVFFNLLLLSKIQREFFEENKPKRARFIIFKLLETPSRYLSYVQRIVITQEPTFAKTSSFSRISNTRFLRIDDCDLLSDEIIKYIPQLRVLHLYDCKGFGVKNFRFVKYINDIRIDFSKSKMFNPSSISNLTDKIFTFHPFGIKKIVLKDCHGFRSGGFKPLKNLKELELHNCPHINNNIFSKLPNLESLVLNDCKMFTTRGFKNVLPKLLYLEIEQCDGISIDVKQCFLSRRGFQFKYINARYSLPPSTVLFNNKKKDKNEYFE